uniref:Putative reverse transcriptase domain-containing protein n=1 Tax=Tanacetum cinerariifolium TaxID=118510 RepID=A0A6L2LCF8_TANCI|nr:putative reverse transcriptase domain-containing protein [Tanacetum cinerariifolium]
MTIPKKSSLHEVDHHENVVFLVILQNLEKFLENVLVLVLMEYLLIVHPGQWKLTQENQVKARSTLMMGIPSEHQLKLNSIKDAKKLMEAVEKRFVNTAHGVSIASTQVNAAYSKNIDNLSDAVICSFFASQPNSPQLIHEDLEQIHPYGMEKIDLRWQMAMLTMRAKRFLKKTGNKLTVNGNETIEEGPNYALMAFSSLSSDSEVSNDFACLKSCLETVKLLKSQNDQLLKDLKKSELMVLGYKRGLESVEEKLEFYKTNEFVNKPVVENCKAKFSEEEPKVDRKNDDAPIIEEWVSDNEKEDVSQAKIKNKIVRLSIAKIEFVKSKQQVKTARKTIKQVEHIGKTLTVDCNYHRKQFQNQRMIKPIWNDAHRGNPHMDLQDQGVIDSGYSRHMTRNMFYLTDYEKIDGGYVAFGGSPKGGKITRKCTIKTDDYSRFTWVFFLATKDETSGILKSFITKIENLVAHKVKMIRCDNGTEFKNKEMNQFYEMKGILRQFSVTRNPQQNKVAERRNKILIEAVRTMLADFKLPTTFRAEAVNTACYVQNRVLVVKPHNKTPYELFMEDNVNSTNNVNTVSSIVNIGGTNRVNGVGENISIKLQFDPNLPALEDVSTFDFPSNDEDDDHPLDQVIGDLQSAIQTRKMSKNLEEHRTQKGNHALKDPSWIEAMQVFKNKKDEMGIVIRNKARLVAQGYTQEERIDYDKVFAPVARIEVIRLFLAYASFKDFVVYQMDVKSDLLYEKIEEEVYVCQTPKFEDPDFLDRVYKELCIAFEKLMHEKFQMSFIRELAYFLGLQVKQKKDGTFISQDKYVAEILKKFGFTEVKTVSTPMETQKPLLKDKDGEEVDVHMYRSMIGSLMYLTSSRPDIVFVVYACVRYQVNPKVSHLYAMKRIFREALLHAKVDGKKIIVTESSVRRDLRLADEEGIDCLPNSTIFEQIALMGCQETMEDTIAQTRFERVSKQSNDLQLAGGNILQSDKDIMKLNELMAVCTTLQNRVLDLEKTKTSQHNEIASLKKRVKKLEKKNRSKTYRMKRLYKVGLTARVESSGDEEILGEDESKQGRTPRNRRREDKDEESEENPFGDGSSFDEQSVMRPRDTLNPEGFIDWLAAVEEVFEFKEGSKSVEYYTTEFYQLMARNDIQEREDQLVSQYIGGLRVKIMDSVNMFDPMTLSDAFQRALAFQKQNRRVGSLYSPSITGVSSSGNAVSRFAPNQAKAGGECKKPRKRHLFADPKKNDDDVAYGDYEEAPVYEEEPEYEEEYVSGDVGVNLVVRRSCLTPKADSDDWLKHNIFQSTCTILGQDCTLVCDPGKEVAEDREIPKAMIPLLEEFIDVFPDELLDGLPPLHDIQHHIDLEPGSQLPNKPHYRMSLGEHEELCRPGDEWKTTFKIHEGLYEWLVMPFDLSNTPNCMKGKSFVWTEEAKLAFHQGGRPVSYFSKKLTEPKSRYTTYDLEFYAVVQAVKHWHHYLFHKEFVLFTDHDSLRHIRTQDKVSHKHGRWLAFREKFTFVVKHKTGVSSRVADALSRRNSLLVTMQVDVPGLDLIRDMVIVDPYFSVVLQGVQSREKIDFVLHDGFIFKGNQLCIPNSSLHLQIIKELHGEGHVGHDLTLQLVQASYFLPTMRKEVDRYVKRDVYRLHGLPSSIVFDRDTRSLGNLLRCLVGDHVKAYDQKLCQAEFAHNHAVNRSTGFSPFQNFVAGLHDVHKAVRDNLVRANSKYKQDADQKRRHVDFEIDDFVWDVLTKDRFPVDVFNVKHLLPYHGDSSDEDSIGNSRTNFVYPGGNDVNPSIEERADLRIDIIDADEDITLFSVQDDAAKEMFDVDTLVCEEVFVAGQNENVVEEVVDAAQDKGKRIMIEEPVKPKKKDQIRLDEEAAKKLQDEFDQEERLAREKAEKEERANITLIQT